MCSDRSTAVTAAVSFLIRISTDRSLVGSSPWLIAVAHVLHRLQAPRHPPLALCSLENKDARARSGILKGPAGTRRALNHRRISSVAEAGACGASGRRPNGYDGITGKGATEWSLPQNGRAGARHR